MPSLKRTGVVAPDGRVWTLSCKQDWSYRPGSSDVWIGCLVSWCWYLLPQSWRYRVLIGRSSSWQVSAETGGPPPKRQLLRIECDRDTVDVTLDELADRIRSGIPLAGPRPEGPADDSTGLA